MSARLAIILPCLLGAPALAADLPSLALPVDCVPGETCVIQKYVDVDGSAAIADYTCGFLSSDGHQGTDFRILPGGAANVLAAAAGRVKATREGMPDNDFTTPLDVPGTRACGNAVVLDHGGGVETLYCHMTPGSVAVRSGDEVEQGAVLGRVGASGQAEFAHVHLQLMVDGKVTDPFTGLAQDEAACGETGTALWNADAAEALADTPRTAVIAAGFAGGPVTIPAIEAGAVPAALDREAEAIVAYGLGFGLEKGDRHRLVINGPGVAVENETGQDRDQAQAMRFAGRRVEGGLAPGRYTMRYTILRDDAVVDEIERTLTVE